MDGKQKGKYNWDEIKEPFYDSKAGSTSFLMRITGVVNKGKKSKVKATLEDYNIPKGVYQIVGHTMIRHFDLPNGYSSDRPLIIPDEENEAFVQFSDVGIGFNYKYKSLSRPKVVINRDLSQNTGFF